MNRTFTLIAGLSAVLMLFAGCYTRFAGPAYRKTVAPPRADSTYVPDSTRDSTTATARVDTVREIEQETCFWVRNYWGEPELRCFDSYRSDPWYSYQHYPWWYRSSWYSNSLYYYDRDRCPRYYYFDPTCGCCRYFREDPYWSGGGGGSGSGGSGGTSGPSAPARRSR